MTAAKPKYAPEPRCWTSIQVCERLGCSLSWFAANRARLYRAGMPQPDELLGGKTDAKALEAWLDRRAGLIDALGASSDPDPFAERAQGRSHGHA